MQKKKKRKNLRSKDHKCSNYFFSKLIYSLHVTKDMEFYRRTAKTEQAKSQKKKPERQKLTISSKFNYPLPSASKSISGKFDSIPCIDSTD